MRACRSFDPLKKYRSPFTENGDPFLFFSVFLFFGQVGHITARPANAISHIMRHSCEVFAAFGIGARKKVRFFIVDPTVPHPMRMHGAYGGYRRGCGGGCRGGNNRRLGHGRSRRQKAAQNIGRQTGECLSFFPPPKSNSFLYFFVVFVAFFLFFAAEKPNLPRRRPRA